MVKTIINHPPVITISRWYGPDGYHSQMGGLLLTEEKHQDVRDDHWGCGGGISDHALGLRLGLGWLGVSLKGCRGSTNSLGSTGLNHQPIGSTWDLMGISWDSQTWLGNSQTQWRFIAGKTIGLNGAFCIGVFCRGKPSGCAKKSGNHDTFGAIALAHRLRSACIMGDSHHPLWMTWHDEGYRKGTPSYKLIYNPL